MGIGCAVRKCVFLDRDGVLNEANVREGKPYPPANISEVRIVSGAKEALQKLREAGFLLIVVTNQPDVARGTANVEGINSINALLERELPLDAFYVCTHDDEDHCDCRKPRPGALFKAAQDYGIDLAQSFMVGDRWRDVSAGKAAGCFAVWVDYDYQEKHPIEHDYRAKDLQDAVSWILSGAKI